MHSFNLCIVNEKNEMKSQLFLSNHKNNVDKCVILVSLDLNVPD